MGAAEAGSAGPDYPLHGVAVDITLERVGAPFFSIKPNHHFLSRIEENPGHALAAVFNLPGSQNLNEGPRFKEVLGSHLVQNRGLFPVLHHQDCEAIAGDFDRIRMEAQLLDRHHIAEDPCRARRRQAEEHEGKRKTCQTTFAQDMHRSSFYKIAFMTPLFKPGSARICYEAKQNGCHLSFRLPAAKHVPSRDMLKPDARQKSRTPSSFAALCGKPGCG